MPSYGDLVALEQVEERLGTCPPLVFAGPGLAVPLVLLVSLAVPRNGRGLHDRLAGTTVVSIVER